MNDCVTSTLAPYVPSAGEWTTAHVAHLYRSVAYGANYDTIQAGLLMTPSELVTLLLDQAVDAPLPATPLWSEWNNEDYEDTDLEGEHFDEIKIQWFRRGVDHGFQQKMSIFWHDHFSTEKRVYRCNSYMWKYYKLLNEHTFGNFRTFVENMGKTEAMLVYLDGNDNVVGQPNENYARELMELFTMGENNGYTQVDIAEIAKALTGWRVSRYLCTPKMFSEDHHDTSVKNIFGQSGDFDYDDVHELIFTLRKEQVAQYICTKLYQHFVFSEIDEDIVAGLAQTFIDNDWEILPVLSQLLSSEHFYETVFHGAKIKSPIDVVTQLFVPIGLDMDVDVDENIYDYMDLVTRRMGQQIFEPPNVAGWPGYRFWLTENSLAFRWSYSHSILNNYINDSGYEKLRTLAISLSSSINDPAEITSTFCDHILGIPLEVDLKEVGTLHLKAGIPENYFEDGSWNLYWDEVPQQLLNLLHYLVQLPEYQLN